jgi:hypothetical protein
MAGSALVTASSQRKKRMKTYRNRPGQRRPRPQARLELLDAAPGWGGTVFLQKGARVLKFPIVKFASMPVRSGWWSAASWSVCFREHQAWRPGCARRTMRLHDVAAGGARARHSRAPGADQVLDPGNVGALARTLFPGRGRWSCPGTVRLLGGRPPRPAPRPGTVPVARESTSPVPGPALSWVGGLRHGLAGTEAVSRTTRLCGPGVLVLGNEEKACARRAQARHPARDLPHGPALRFP